MRGGGGQVDKEGIWITPFENTQRWMGKNTLTVLLLNDDNMIGEIPDMCPFEKKEIEVFRQPIFFSGTKKKISKKQLLFSFLSIVKQKKFSEWSENFWNFSTFNNH